MLRRQIAAVHMKLVLVNAESGIVDMNEFSKNVFSEVVGRFLRSIKTNTRNSGHEAISSVRLHETPLIAN